LIGTKWNSGRRLLACALFFGTLSPWIIGVNLVYSEVQTITASHTYLLGDNDSRNDARHLCFLEAKRKVLEMAGVYIQSHDVVTNAELTKSQIVSYSAAILSVETLKDEFKSANGQSLLTMTVKAEVDTEDVRKRLKAIAEDKQLQQRVARQQNQLLDLETRVRQLSSSLNIAALDSAVEMRNERNVVIGNIEELEKKKLAAMRRIAEEEDKAREVTEKIRQFILLKMTKREVDEILGPPLKSIYTWKGPFFYGELWICFEDRLGSGDYRVSGVGATSECKPNLLAK